MMQKACAGPGSVQRTLLVGLLVAVALGVMMGPAVPASPGAVQPPLAPLDQLLSPGGRIPTGAQGSWVQPAPGNALNDCCGPPVGITSVGGVPYAALMDRPGSITKLLVKADRPAPPGNYFAWNRVGPPIPSGTQASAVGASLTSDGVTPYVAWEQSGDARTPNGIYATELVRGAWVSTSALNVDPTKGAFSPSIATVGSTPYVAWREHTGRSYPLSGGGAQFVGAIRVARHVFGGEWAASGSPTLNPARNSFSPSMGGVDGVPYVAWFQENADGGAASLNVARFTGAEWSAVGNSLNTSSTIRYGFYGDHPSIAGLGGVPYVAWSESGGTAGPSSQVRVKQFAGGVWRSVGGSLNMNAANNAYCPSMTAVGGVPYLAWLETPPNQQGEVHVKRFAGGAWRSVGGALNEFYRADGCPSITAVGGMPYVVFGEDVPPCVVFCFPCQFCPPARLLVLVKRFQSVNGSVTGFAARTTPAGTRFSFRLGKGAVVRLDFTQPTTGRRVGRGCVAPTNANRKNPRCTRIVNIGSLSVHGHAGRNTFIFTGRIQGKALKPGPYTVVAATAADARKGLYAAAPFRKRR